MRFSIVETYSPRTLLVAWRTLLVVSAIAVVWCSGGNEQKPDSVPQTGALAAFHASPGDMDVRLQHDSRVSRQVDGDGHAD